MLKCKICNKNETDNTAGICWKCSGNYYVLINPIDGTKKYYHSDKNFGYIEPIVEPPMDMGEGHSKNTIYVDYCRNTTFS